MKISSHCKREEIRLLMVVTPVIRDNIMVELTAPVGLNGV